MSYNIDTVHEHVLEATMRAKDVLALLKREDMLPEDNFLADMGDAARAAKKEGDPNRLIPLRSLNWRGSFSGNSFDFLTDVVAKKIKGTVEAVIVWEGGNSQDSLVIENGKVIESELVIEIRRVPK